MAYPPGTTFAPPPVAHHGHTYQMEAELSAGGHLHPQRPQSHLNGHVPNFLPNGYHQPSFKPAPEPYSDGATPTTMQDGFQGPPEETGVTPFQMNHSHQFFVQPQARSWTSEQLRHIPWEQLESRFNNFLQSTSYPAEWMPQLRQTYYDTAISVRQEQSPMEVASKGKQSWKPKPRRKRDRWSYGERRVRAVLHGRLPYAELTAKEIKRYEKVYEKYYKEGNHSTEMKDFPAFAVKEVGYPEKKLSSSF